MSKRAVVSVDIDFNKLKTYRASLKGGKLTKAAMAGGLVIKTHAILNAQRVFSTTSTKQLANSTETTLEKERDGYVEVAIAPTVIYARIQEMGGTIRPKNAKLLRFVIDGRVIFAKSVTLPARPYLRPAADEHHSEILGAIKHQVIEDMP